MRDFPNPPVQVTLGMMLRNTRAYLAPFTSSASDSTVPAKTSKFDTEHYPRITSSAPGCLHVASSHKRQGAQIVLGTPLFSTGLLGLWQVDIDSLSYKKQTSKRVSSPWIGEVTN